MSYGTRKPAILDVVKIKGSEAFKNEWGTITSICSTSMTVTFSGNRIGIYEISTPVIFKDKVMDHAKAAAERIYKVFGVSND